MLFVNTLQDQDRPLVGFWQFRVDLVIVMADFVRDDLVSVRDDFVIVRADSGSIANM